ncbi:MAG: RagB/SusD family nutrient uptake outer membrane protein [Bacteroidales bacterium]|nr:RagB/SusD family nutrient uptake outer membrane protein [Bacteroidales bacterium]
MNRFVKILTIVLLAAGMVACESMKLGDAGLSKAPETSGATLDTLFATLKDADKVLAQAYYYLPYGLPTDFDDKLGDSPLEAITDHYVSNSKKAGDGPTGLYYTGALGAGTSTTGWAYAFGKEKDYSTIRYAWFFLENADRIPNADPVLLARKKAEAKMCMAIAYANMVRYVGGVPIVDHAISLGEPLEFPRNTFEETINYIVKLCDEAAPDLPWSVDPVDDGRLTRAAALGLKLRILCFAASPTFNSDTKWHPQADEYTCYGNYSAARWQAAKAAADEFMKEQLSNGFYALVQAKPDAMGLYTPRSYRMAYRSGYYDRGTTESIISTRKSNSGFHDEFVDDINDYGNGATLTWVNKFPFADGTPFPEDFDWEHKENWPEYPFFKPDPNGDLEVNNAKFIETRDPRLYENICVPGDIWRSGTVGPCYDGAKGRQDNCPGFLQMKYVLQYSTDRKDHLTHWCLMRFAEVLLNAAEAYNEADGGPSDKAYTWVNAVRARVGLPGLPEGMNQEEFRKALILERELEFGFEEVRWFDMVRWGLTEAFTTPLLGLYSLGNSNQNATSFTHAIKEARPSRQWYTKWDTKWYLSPIPSSEVNKNYGMTQNPGW